MSPFSLDFLSTKRSNLQSFLQSVTPIVPSKPLPRSNMDDQSSTWNPNGDEYFTLGDLWDCYEEWSAYGVGAPISLKDEIVVQYYAPYLSAVQIYTIRSPSTLRNSSGDEVDGIDFEMESWSDASDSTDKLSRSLSNNSISADSCLDQVEVSRDRLGYLYFQYSEICTPYWRIPFADKIFELSQNYPGLATLKSTDLSAASWMAVAWYPIYHVPMKRIVKNVSASFLTYHTLSSSFQDAVEENEADSGIRLSPFGLAAHRMQNDIWINSDAQDYEKLNDLQSAADSWLKQLSFHHHDYNFFTSHNNIELGFPF